MNTTAVPVLQPQSSVVALATITLVSIQLAMFLVALSNVIVMITIIFVRAMHTVTNLYILNLCAADFLYIGVLPLTSITSLEHAWIFSKTTCQMFYLADGLGKYCSACFITVLSVDRYLALCKPAWCDKYRSVSTALGVSLFFWTLVGASVAPLFIYSDVVINRNGIPLCTIRWPNVRTSKWFIGCSFILTYLLPVFVIIFCYVHVLRKLEEAIRRTKRLKRSKTRENRYRRVTRMVLAVIGFYVLCWTPYWLYNMLAVMVLNVSTSGSLRIVMNFVHLLPYVNSSLNPLLYAILTHDFKEAFNSPDSCYRYCCKSGMERGSSVYVSTAHSTRHRTTTAASSRTKRSLFSFAGPTTLLFDMSDQTVSEETRSFKYRGQSMGNSFQSLETQVLIYEQTNEVYL